MFERIHVMPRHRQERFLLVFGVATAVLAVAAGAAIAMDPLFGIVLGVALLPVVITLVTGASLERTATIVLIGGTFVLGYGFANLGIQSGGPPIPLTELLLIPLVVLALMDARTRVPGTVLVPLVSFAVIVTARMIVDYPVYRTLAIRDTTLAIEAFALVLGYRVVARDGLAPWVRRLGVLFAVMLLYASFYPWREILNSVSPTVGLQRDVPLLGSFQGLAPRLALVALFFAVYSTRLRRVAMVGWALALALLTQSRGVYLVLPAAALALGWARRASTRVLIGGLAFLVPGLLFLSLLVGTGVEGRLGGATPDFYTGHIATLFGGEGPSVGTLDDRVAWADKTLEFVARSPVTVLFGTGLGPDLTFGFKQGGEILVRKPHNDFLEVYARTGLIGFGVFIWLIAAAVVPLVRRARADAGPAGTFCSFVIATVVVMFGIALTQPLLAFPHGAVPTFFILGAGVAAARERPPVEA
jgi:O-antigen ligase